MTKDEDPLVSEVQDLRLEVDRLLESLDETRTLLRDATDELGVVQALHHEAVRQRDRNQTELWEMEKQRDAARTLLKSRLKRIWEIMQDDESVRDINMRAELLRPLPWENQDG